MTHRSQKIASDDCNVNSHSNSNNNSERANKFADYCCTFPWKRRAIDKALLACVVLTAASNSNNNNKYDDDELANVMLRLARSQAKIGAPAFESPQPMRPRDNRGQFDFDFGHLWAPGLHPSGPYANSFDSMAQSRRGTSIETPAATNIGIGKGMDMDMDSGDMVTGDGNPQLNARATPRPSSSKARRTGTTMRWQQQQQDASNDFLQQLSALNGVATGRAGGGNKNIASLADRYRSDNKRYTGGNEDNANKRQASRTGLPRQQQEGIGSEMVHVNAANNGGPAHSVSTRSESSAQDDEQPNEQADVRAGAEMDSELGIDLPYGIQNVRKRDARSEMTTYQSLCPTKRITIPLETSGYEYRPNHYIEVTCTNAYSQSYNSRNKVCSETGFSCIQLNRTIHLIRRSKALNIDCWESEIRIVPSGCECMWPKHSLGDIRLYHETRKRYNPQANVEAIADYTAGQGYQQLPRQVQLVGLDGLQRDEIDGTGNEAYRLN